MGRRSRSQRRAHAQRMQRAQNASAWRASCANTAQGAERDVSVGVPSNSMRNPRLRDTSSFGKVNTRDWYTYPGEYLQTCNDDVPM